MKHLTIILLLLMVGGGCKEKDDSWAAHYKKCESQVQVFVLKEKKPIKVIGEDGAFGWSYTLISADNKMLTVNNTSLHLPKEIK